MGLSFEKLKEFIRSKKYVIIKIFSFEKRIFMLELVSTINHSNFFLYIPSKYKFPCDTIKTFTLQYISMEHRKTIDEYTKGINQEDVEDVYGNEEIEIAPGDNDDIEEHLEDKYKRDINVKNISKNVLKDINAVYRQVKRLGYSVHNIPYKICIIYENILCSIRGSNDIETFIIKHYPKNLKKRMYVIVNLEKFFDSNERILGDLETVRTNLHNLLEKNQNSTIYAMTSIMENKEKLIQGTGIEIDDINTKLKKLSNIIEGLNKKEQELLLELSNLSKEGVGNNNLSVKRSKLNDELYKISLLRENSVKIYMELEEKKDHSLLSIDKILFDNTVMLNNILKNFESLKEFIA